MENNTYLIEFRNRVMIDIIKIESCNILDAIYQFSLQCPMFLIISITCVENK